MNVIKKYWDSVYIYVLLLVPGMCMCAGTFWTLAKVRGIYPNLPWGQILVFDCSQMIYLFIALYFMYRNKKDSAYIHNHLNYVKTFIVSSLFIQYNFILYLFSSPYVWGCTILFFALLVFLFDSKLMIINVVLYSISLVAAHIIRPEDFLPMDEPGIQGIISFRIVVFTCTSLCIILIVYFVEHFLMEAWDKDEENVHLIEKQLEYYKDMELMDVELRKFRHDINNHFVVMEYLFNNQKLEELQGYFKELQESYSFQQKYIFSGNDIVDAILSNDLKRHCDEKVKVETYGNLPEIKTVSSMDLCTLFSNLLSNAITAANQCSDTGNAQISISFSSGKKYFSISVSNSIPANGNEARHKKGDRNHGYGLHKIKEVLGKYDGKIERSVDDEKIEITVYLPI